MCQALKWWWKKVTAPALPEDYEGHYYVGWVYADYLPYVMGNEDFHYFEWVRLHCDGKPAYRKVEGRGPFFCEGDDGKEYLLLAKWVLR